MIKTFTTIVLLLLLLILFQANIKGWIEEHRLDLAISSLNLSVEMDERLHAIAVRVGQGHVGRDFTEIEKQTLLELRAELKALEQLENDPAGLEAAAKELEGQYEAILRRHKL